MGVRLSTYPNVQTHETVPWADPDRVALAHALALAALAEKCATNDCDRWMPRRVGVRWGRRPEPPHPLLTGPSTAPSPPDRAIDDAIPS